MSKEIFYLSGDATRPDKESSTNKFIVHICNDIGAWGAGFVLALSNKWIVTQMSYQSWYKNWQRNLQGFDFDLGMVQFVPVRETLDDHIVVVNMIAQHGISDGRGNNPTPIVYGAVKACLTRTFKVANQNNATIHMPRIGCGLAGGEWGRILRIIVQVQERYPVDVYVYDLPSRGRNKSIDDGEGMD